MTIHQVQNNIDRIPPALLFISLELQSLLEVYGLRTDRELVKIWFRQLVKNVFVLADSLDIDREENSRTWYQMTGGFIRFSDDDLDRLYGQTLARVKNARTLPGCQRLKRKKKAREAAKTEKRRGARASYDLRPEVIQATKDLQIITGVCQWHSGSGCMPAIGKLAGWEHPD
jgi:hypothetical protein